MKLEPFANYQDVKTKTVNWCNKMQKSGLLSSDQFNECVSTFTDATTEFLPDDFKIPNTGISRNFSLYNTRQQKLTPNISGENTNIVLLVNRLGYYMGCNEDNTVYFIKDINDGSVNQQEIYFTLVPQNNTVYALMSSYGKYLIANAGPQMADDTTIPKGQSSRQDWCASFTGKSIGPMSNWTVKIYQSGGSSDGSSGGSGGGSGDGSGGGSGDGSDASGSGSSVDDSINKVSFEAVQISNFFLSSNQNSQDESLQIVYGSDDTTIWSIIPKTNMDNNEESNSVSTEYLVAKDNLMSNLISIKSQILSIEAFKETLEKIKDNIRNNYVNIQNYVSQILNNQIPNTADNIVYKDNGDTEETLENEDDMMQTPTLPNELIEQQILETDDTDGGQKASEIPTVSMPTVSMPTVPIIEKFANNTMSMSSDEKLTAINNIMNMQNTYLQQINSDISRINILLSELKTKETTVESDFKTFREALTKKLAEIKQTISKNKDIMNRQKMSYDKLNDDYAYVETKKQKTEKIDEISKINSDMVSKYSSNNETLTKIYPLIIFLLILGLLYLCYIAYGNFMENIYHNY